MNNFCFEDTWNGYVKCNGPFVRKSFANKSWNQCSNTCLSQISQMVVLNRLRYPKLLPPLWINLNAFHAYLRTAQLPAPSHPSIIRKHHSILTSSHRCHNIFKSAPIVAFRCTNNFGNFLARAIMQPFTKLHTSPLRGYFQYGSQQAYFLHIPKDLLPTALPATLHRDLDSRRFSFPDCLTVLFVCSANPHA